MIYNIFNYNVFTQRGDFFNYRFVINQASADLIYSANRRKDGILCLR